MKTKSLPQAAHTYTAPFCSPATMKQLKHFPELYKRQATQIIRDVGHDVVNTTVDAMICASLIALIEEFQFGNTRNSTKLKRFVKRVNELIDINSLYYGDAVAYGLQNKLHNLGVEYDMKGSKVK